MKLDKIDILLLVGVGVCQTITVLFSIILGACLGGW